MSNSKGYQEIIKGFIDDYPVCEYYLLKREELMFSEEVRLMCEMEPRFDHQPWTYLPAIGTIEECRDICGAFEHVFIYTTVTEVRDSRDFLACLEAKRSHEQFSYQLQEKFREHFGDVLTLTTGCAICEQCAVPGNPCRNPDKSLSTIESHGVFIMQTVEKLGICYDYGYDVATYLGLIFFNN